MTRKIFRAIVACALIVLAICVATMSVCLYQSRKQSVFREMDVEAELIARRQRPSSNALSFPGDTTNRKTGDFLDPATFSARKA